MKEKRKWGESGEWYVVIQFVLFGLIFFAPLLMPDFFKWPAPWDSVGLLLGIGLSLFGGLMAVAGVLSLGRNLTAVPYPKEDAVLVESGAFRFVRHPIYSGIIFGALGWGFLNNSLLTLLLALVLFLFFDVKSRREEVWLSNKFSNYAAYQLRVRKLIPLVY
ncbi:MAG: isoprenylcysteine carboxylmethyltransferase family protein [Anaerolineae bacterium]|nr:MAG: isoprenylcysteine carboxylmethyltransferase family protein [Anaerolineae bacterium]